MRTVHETQEDRNQSAPNGTKPVLFRVKLFLVRALTIKPKSCFTSSAISKRALLLLSHLDRYMAVSFSSFLIFLVICNTKDTSQQSRRNRVPPPPPPPLLSYTHTVTQTSHLLHLLFEGGEDLVALGQSGLKLLKLLCVEWQLEKHRFDHIKTLVATFSQFSHSQLSYRRWSVKTAGKPAVWGELPAASSAHTSSETPLLLSAADKMKEREKQL